MIFGMQPQVDILSRSEFYRELARMTSIPGLAAEFEAKADQVAGRTAACTGSFCPFCSKHILAPARHRTPPGTPLKGV